jgi:transcriptional regulator with XRE-family HTH domain
MRITPSLCRSARALLGWTIEELAEASTVGISTITSFEAGQRVPIRSNQGAIERAFIDAGVIFLEADINGGRGLKLTKSTEALRDILLIGGLKESRDMRVQRAKKRIAQFCDDAAAFYGDGRDNLDRVRNDRGKLRDRVDQEIELRIRLDWDDEPTRFLEPVADLLHENR